MIHGYAKRASVWPGQQLVLHVAGDGSRFRIAFYRWSGSLEHMLTSAWRHCEQQPARGPDDDWQWPEYSFPIAADWPSGAYLAHLEQPGAGAPHLAMADAAVLFVVRGSAAGRLLYKIPLATYNAYNHAGGGCFYDNPPRLNDPPGARLSLRRPGCGCGAPVFGAADFYDPGSPRQRFAHWDARFIGWLVRNGYEPEFCTDLDIHAEPELCASYRLLLSAGHDEYWSEAMHDGMEHFVARGGNAGFFSANLCWWCIHICDSLASMTCHQGGPNGALDDWWPGRPEDPLSGVSYRHGGGWWDGQRTAAGFAVQDPAHWIFAGPGLGLGETFGADTWLPLVGYECDGAPLSAFDEASGGASLHPNAADCGAPPGLRLLAACPLDERWQERPLREAHAGPLHAATMSIFTRGGTVLSAGTTDWAQVLDSGQDARVDTITHNVLDGLLNSATAARSI